MMQVMVDQPCFVYSPRRYSLLSSAGLQGTSRTAKYASATARGGEARKQGGNNCYPRQPDSERNVLLYLCTVQPTVPVFTSVCAWGAGLLFFSILTVAGGAYFPPNRWMRLRQAWCHARAGKCKRTSLDDHEHSLSHR